MDEFRHSETMGEKARFKFLFNEIQNFIQFLENFETNKSALVFLISAVLTNLPGYIDVRKWLPEIFNKFLRSFELPVGEAWSNWGPASAPMHSSLVSGLIISLIGGEDEQSQMVFENLEKLLRAIKDYIHPSNNGKWSDKLLNFLDKLTQKFLDRIRKERHQTEPQWQPLPPTHKLITEGTI